MLRIFIDARILDLGLQQLKTNKNSVFVELRFWVEEAGNRQNMQLAVIVLGSKVKQRQGDWKMQEFQGGNPPGNDA